ncbi:MAG: chemotaxis protein CheC [Candidatus Aenigmarchaeota archaeon]|nr:chemotaxis protein CheC [Candidatus Aenigmarchaeota archaeon]
MKITKFHEDALRELGNMAAGKASSSLSSMVDKKVNLSPPAIDIIPIKKIPELLGGQKKMIVGIYSKLSGNVYGTMMIVMPIKSAMSLSDIMLNKKSGSTKALSQKDQENLIKIGNVMIHNYLNVLINFLGMKTECEKPRIVSTFGESLPDFILLGTKTKYTILLRTDFKISKNVEGDVILSIEVESVPKFIGALEKKLKKG